MSGFCLPSRSDRQRYRSLLRQVFLGSFVCLFLTAQPLFANAPSPREIEQAIKTIQKVDAKGAGHDDAIEAMKVLNQCTVEQIPQLLRAMNDANPLGKNWLRSAVNRAVSSGKPLPAGEIRKYFDDRSGAALARLLAFELLTKHDETLARELVPTLHDDPSLPLRRIGIKWYVKNADAKNDIESIGMLGFALNHARDVDQVQEIKKLLSAKGIEVNLTRQLGYASEWKLVGPFNNKDQKGFDVAYGPEKNLDGINVQDSYDDGVATDGSAKTVKWVEHTTLDEMGVVDLNKAVGKIKGVVVYAYTEFESAEDCEAEIRIGCINGNKVWVNGKEVISNEVYHVGMMPDQFSGTTKLKKGTNRILFKVCQNEMTQPWAQRWMFQLRVCDSTGKSIPPADEGQPAGE